MKEIKLTRGCVTKVSDEDYEYLNQWTWYVSHDGYAVRTKGSRTKKLFQTFYMHRLLMGFPANGKQVDHINGDRLDNRRENLRIVSITQNHMNARTQSRNKWGYKGVIKESDNSWSAYIGYKNKRYYLGCFATPEDAARAYDKKAKELAGEYARLNFV